MLMSFDPYEVAAADPTADMALSFELNEELAEQHSLIMGAIFQAAFLDNMEALQAAWRQVMSRPEGDPLLARFTAPPFPEEQTEEMVERYTSGTRAQIQLVDEWTSAYRERYNQIRGAN